MAYASLEAEIDGSYLKLANKLLRADKLMEDFLSKKRVLNLELDDSVYGRLKEIADIVKVIGGKKATIKIKTEADAGGARVAKAAIDEVGKAADKAGAKIAVVHRNLDDLGKTGQTGIRLNTKDLVKGLEQVRAGVLRYKEAFGSGTGSADITAQINKLEKFFSGQGIKADAFNRVIPELQRLLKLQEHIKGNREVEFEIHVNEKGVADLKNIGLLIDGAQQRLNDYNLKARQRADQLRNAGVVASVVGSRETVNGGLLKRLQAQNIAPNTLTGIGENLMPQRLVTAVQLEELARYDELLKNAKSETQKFSEELAKSGLVAGRVTAGFEKTGASINKRLRASAEEAQKARQVYTAFGKSMDGLSKYASQLQNTIVRWALGYAAVSQLINGINTLKAAVIDFNGQLDQARVALSTLLDSDKAADNLINKLRQFAKETPFEFADLLPLTQKLINLGVVAKSQAETKVVPALTAIGNAVAGLGGGAAEIESIIRALGQMSTKGKLQAEELTQQLAEVGIDGTKYIAAAMRKTVPEIFALMKKGAIDGKKAMNAILQGLAIDPQFAGLMEKQSTKFVGLVSNLKDAATDLASRGFRPLYDEVGNLAGELGRLANSPAGEAWAKRTSETVAGLILRVKAAVRTLMDLRAIFEGVGGVIAITFGAAKINQIVRMAGALAQFRNAAASLGAVEAAAQFLPALAPALAPLLAFLANPYVLAVVAGTAALAGIYAWVKYRKNLAQVREEHAVLAQSAIDTAAGLQTLTDAAAGNSEAILVVAKLRRSINSAGKDAQGVKTSLTEIAQARYEIKKLKLDPLTLRIIDDEMNRLKESIEKKAIVLHLKIETGNVVTDIDKAAAAAATKAAADAKVAAANKAALDKAYAAAVAQNRRFFAGPDLQFSDVELKMMQRRTGLTGSAEEILDQISQRSASDVVARSRASDNRATKLSGALETYRTAKDSKGQIAALKAAIALREKSVAAQKEGLTLDADERAGLAKLNRILAQRKALANIPHFDADADTKKKKGKTDAEKAAEKAERARKILERDRLNDAASAYELMARDSEKAYEDMARAAEESSKRQMDAILGVRDALRDVLGGMQESFAKFGLVSSPLDAGFSRIEKILGIGNKLAGLAGHLGDTVTGIANKGNAAIQNARNNATNARNQAELLSGGDGQNAGGRGGSAAKEASNAMLLQIAKSFTSGEPYLSCAFVASRLANAVGANIKTTASAGQLRQNAIAAGWTKVDAGATQRGDLIFNRREGGSGWHVKMGAGGGQVLNSNHRQETLYNYKGRPGDEAYRAPALGSGISSEGGTTDDSKLNLRSALELVTQIRKEIKGASLLKFAPLPKAWGAPLKDSAENTFRFQTQMVLANRATQSLLRTVLGDKKFAQLAKELRGLSWEADKLNTSLEATARLEAQTKELADRRRTRGTEDNPLAALAVSARSGGPNSSASLESMIGAWWATRQDALDDVDSLIKTARRNAKDQLSITRAGAPFVGADTVDSYGQSRAQELASRKVDFRNGTSMKALYYAGTKDGDTQALKEYNKRLREFGTIQETVYDEEKGRERQAMIAGQRQELIRSGQALKQQLAALQNQSVGEVQLSEQLAREASLRDKLNELRDAGFKGEALNRLATELVDREQLNRKTQRQIDLQQQLNPLLREARDSISLGATKRAIYASMSSDDPRLEMTLARAEKVQEVLKKYNGPTVQAAQELRASDSVADDNFQTNQEAQSAARATQAEVDLKERAYELVRGASEYQKQLWQYERDGAAVSEQEASNRERVLATLQRIDALKPTQWLKEQRDSLTLDNPKLSTRGRDDLQFRMDKMSAGWTDEQINGALPVDRAMRKLREGREAINGLLADWKNSWGQMWQDMAQKGEFSLGGMLDNMTQRLWQFGADLLSSKVWDLITNLFTSAAVGSFGGGSSKSAANMGSGTGVNLRADSLATGLDRVPYDGYLALLHKNEKVLSAAQATVNRDASRRDAAREVSRATPAQSARSASGGSEPMNFFGDIHLPNVRRESDMPSALKGAAKGIKNSRRTNSKQSQQFVFNGG